MAPCMKPPLKCMNQGTYGSIRFQVSQINLLAQAVLASYIGRIWVRDFVLGQLAPTPISLIEGPHQ